MSLAPDEEYALIRPLDKRPHDVFNAAGDSTSEAANDVDHAVGIRVFRRPRKPAILGNKGNASLYAVSGNEETRIEMLDEDDNSELLESQLTLSWQLTGMVVHTGNMSLEEMEMVRKPSSM